MPLRPVPALKPGQHIYPVARDCFREGAENILYFCFDPKDIVEDVGVVGSAEKEMLRSAITAVSRIADLNHRSHEFWQKV